MMNAAITYFIEASICLLAGGALYFVLFRRGSYLKTRRAAILLLTALALIIPLLEFTYTVSGNTPTPVAYMLQEVVISVESMMLPELVIGSEQAASPILWVDFLFYAYVVVSSLLLLFFFIQLIKINRFKNRFPSQSMDGVKIVNMKGSHPTFSFFNLIFFNPPKNITAQDKDQILQHELAHVNQWHSLDNLLMETTKVIFWFHPVMWYFQKELKNVHEFLADDSVTRNSDLSDYQSLLSRLTLDANSISLGHYFNSSQTLNRLKMITTQKRPVAKWKIGLSTLMIALLFVTFSCQEEVLNDINSIENTMAQMAPPPDVEKSMTKLQAEYPDVKFTYFETDKENLDKAKKLQTLDSETIAGIFVNPAKKEGVIGIILSDRAGWNANQTMSADSGEEVFTIVEDPAAPEGGMETFYKHVMMNMKYPAQARKMGIEGKVFVQFVVDKDGSIGNVSAVKGIGAGCDAEAVRVVASAPAWNPAKQKGVVVRQRIVLPLTFKLGDGDKNNAIIVDPVKDNGSKPIDQSVNVTEEVDEVAAPVGGYETLYKALASNMKYPQEAKDNNISGRVFVEFVVSTQGELINLKTLKGIGYGCDEEALRAVKSTAVKWSPAQKDGKAVNQKIVLPITFSQE